MIHQTAPPAPPVQGADRDSTSMQLPIIGMKKKTKKASVGNAASGICAEQQRGGPKRRLSSHREGQEALGSLGSPRLLTCLPPSNIAGAKQQTCDRRSFPKLSRIPSILSQIITVNNPSH